MLTHKKGNKMTIKIEKQVNDMLNNMIDKKVKHKLKSDITTIQKANSKKLISVKELKELYGYSESAQKGFRSRLNNPIPFIQQGIGTKILYNKDEVNKWLAGKKR